MGGRGRPGGSSLCIAKGQGVKTKSVPLRIFTQTSAWSRECERFKQEGGHSIKWELINNSGPVSRPCPDIAQTGGLKSDVWGRFIDRYSGW